MVSCIFFTLRFWLRSPLRTFKPACHLSSFTFIPNFFVSSHYSLCTVFSSAYAHSHISYITLSPFCSCFQTFVLTLFFAFNVTFYLCLNSFFFFSFIIHSKCCFIQIFFSLDLSKPEHVFLYPKSLLL